jgi:hypothetical protein
MNFGILLWIQWIIIIIINNGNQLRYWNLLDWIEFIETQTEKKSDFFFPVCQNIESDNINIIHSISFEYNKFHSNKARNINY